MYDRIKYPTEPGFYFLYHQREWNIVDVFVPDIEDTNNENCLSFRRRGYHEFVRNSTYHDCWWGPIETPSSNGGDKYNRFCKKISHGTLACDSLVHELRNLSFLANNLRHVMQYDLYSERKRQEVKLEKLGKFAWNLLCLLKPPIILQIDIDNEQAQEWDGSIHQIDYLCRMVELSIEYVYKREIDALLLNMLDTIDNYCIQNSIDIVELLNNHLSSKEEFVSKE